MKGRSDRATLRRRLTALVYRDAARAAGLGLALVVLPLVYVVREWPPWEIRAALRSLPATERAVWLVLAHGLHWLATAPIVRRLLASERLRWWWTLPVPAGFWRRLHLRHLVMLDAAWLGAIAYAVAPLLAAGRRGEAVATGLGFMAITLAGQTSLAAVADRRTAVRTGVLVSWASIVAAAVVLPAAFAAVVGVVGIVGAVHRLGRPLPEPSAVRRGSAGGPAVLALARLGWLAARRRAAVACIWGATLQVLAVGTVALAWRHVGTAEPEAAAALQRGIAVVCAVVGALLGLLATRLLDADRPWLDAWGIAHRTDRRARLLLSAVGAVPAAVAGLVLVAGTGGHAWRWGLDLGIAVGWAATSLTLTGFLLEAARGLHQPQLPRLLLRLGAAVLLVSAAGSTLALLPWLAIDAWRLPAAQRRAERARLRFETTNPDDHER